MEKLIDLLKALGYEYSEETDKSLLEFCRDATEAKIKNRINQTSIPSELEQIAVEMTCGEFLQLKKASGQLAGYDFEAAVSSIKEGDTQVSFASDATAEQKFDAMLANMISGHEADFVRFRKLVW